jgi:hypothetical protein
MSGGEDPKLVDIGDGSAGRVSALLKALQLRLKCWGEVAAITACRGEWGSPPTEGVAGARGWARRSVKD